jgi:hypothetical protein
VIGRGLIAALLLAACGGGGGGSPDASPPDDPLCTATTQLTITGAHPRSPMLAADATGPTLFWFDGDAATGTGFAQRLTATGAPAADRQPLDQPVGGVVAATSDGFVWCYELASQQLQCRTLTAAGLFDFGSAPQLAAGPHGIRLADIGAININSDVRVRTLDDHGLGGPPTTIASFGRFPPIMRLVATTDGYALVTGAHLGPLTVDHLDADGQLIGAPTVVEAIWQGYSVEATATGNDVVLVWPDPTRIVAKIVSAAGAISAPIQIGGYSAFAQPVATAGGFAVTWSDPGGYVAFHAFTADGQPRGTPQSVLDTGWNDNTRSAIAVPDGLLVAVAMQPVTDTIEVVHLACPP